MPEGGQEKLETSLRGDLEALLGKRPDLKVVALADGAVEMQNILERIVREVSDVKRGTLDYWHVIEKLAGAATVCKKGKEKIDIFKKSLKEKENGALEVFLELKAWKSEYKEKEVPEELHSALTYM